MTGESREVVVYTDRKETILRTTSKTKFAKHGNDFNAIERGKIAGFANDVVGDVIH